VLRGQRLTNTISVSTTFSAIFFLKLFWDYLLDKTKKLQICNFKTCIILICLKEHNWQPTAFDGLTLNWWLIEIVVDADPVHYAKIKLFDFIGKQILLVWRSNWKAWKMLASRLEFVQVIKVACYVITAKRASHRFVLEATNNLKNIGVCLKHEAKATRRGLNSSGDERHTSPHPDEAKENQHKTKKNLNYLGLTRNTAGVFRWVAFPNDNACFEYSLESRSMLAFVEYWLMQQIDCMNWKQLWVGMCACLCDAWRRRLNAMCCIC